MTTPTTPRGFSKKPIPTKFRPDEEAILDEASRTTDLKKADLIRRAVRLMGRQKAVFGNYGFLFQQTA